MLSLSLMKKWQKMLTHKSVFHVDQSLGSFYSVKKIRGYYNDLRGKAYYTEKFDKNGIPYNIAAKGEEKKKVYFPITIFQYGLGCYDVYLETDDKEYLQKTLKMANWALEHQAENGSFDAFGCLSYTCPVSSMAQGEACSLLARAFMETGRDAYRTACLKAADFMLTEKADGGTCERTQRGLILHEYPSKTAVLNGWIFSAFGLLDCYKLTKDEKYRVSFEEALQGIKYKLPSFDSGCWSYYDLGGKYTSPFYHSLHIELLKALEDLAPDPVFRKYIEKWSAEKANGLKSRYAFARKALQKLTEKKSDEWYLAE